MAGYIRADVGNNIANGQPADAVYLDLEFDAIVAAFSAATGHVHDGTTGNGGAITVVGPAQEIVVTSSNMRPKTTGTIDLGTDSLRFKDGYFNGTVRSAAFRGIGSGNNSFIASSITSNGSVVHYAFDGHSTTGMGRSGNGELSFYIAGDDVLKITSNLITSEAEIKAPVFDGVATSSNRLSTSRTISLSGAATGTATSFNGTSNISIPVTSLNAGNLSGQVPANSLNAANFPTNSVANDWVGVRSSKVGSSGTAIGSIVMALWVGTDIGVVNYLDESVGSNIRLSSTSGVNSGSSSLQSSTVWRCLGRVNTSRPEEDKVCLWQRVQ